MELVDCEQRVVETGRVDLVERETKCGVRAEQHCGVRVEKLTKLGDLASLAAGGAQVELGTHLPVSEKPVRRQLRWRERRPDRPLGHRHDGLGQTLVEQLVERQEHQGARLAGRRRGLQQQVRRLAFLERKRLHLTHAQRVCRR